jgi:hypothetical protein
MSGSKDIGRANWNGGAKSSGGQRAFFMVSIKFRAPEHWSKLTKKCWFLEAFSILVAWRDMRW